MRRTWVIAVSVAGLVIVTVALVAASAWSTDDGSAPGDETAAEATDGCVRRVPDDVSVARLWNEALLAAIRLDVPAPTVHARNLFHTSAAMWDAWSAWDPAGRSVFVDEKRVGPGIPAEEVRAGREEAISHAVHGILVQRYLLSPGAEESITAFDELMIDLCYDPTDTSVEGDDPAAFGNRIAATILEQTLDDGANESGEYADPAYAPVNPPLAVAESGTTMVDPNRWQPLEIEGMVSQNGIPLTDPVQQFVGSHWGEVTPFAIDPPAAGRLPIDPGPPPLLGDPSTDAAFREEALEVLAHSAVLDPTAPDTIDIGPATMGDRAIDSYESRGHPENPVTGEPYAPDVVALGDYSRAVAEFWADGPASETPPGHWNTIANRVSDTLGDDGRRIGGQGPVVDALEWDVKLYLALNGAVHDAAVAAWGAKGYYDSARPISMIRYMGGLGQSSDPDGPAYHPDGLPLVPGAVEVVTAASSAPGERHAHLADHIGEVAVMAWQGAPDDPETEVGGVGWILAVDWVPYQRPTFVTPAFAGYVSGHSSFSRAAAEVLTAITGSPYFPGGLGEWDVPAGSLEFEAGPSADVVMRWATYVDAADEAGRSRLYGGIHIRSDDLAGRRIGREVGLAAWALAQRHYEGAVG